MSEAWKRRALLAVSVLGAGAWLALLTWRLTRVPGMSMDEGWFIATARGKWQTVNPLSGMTTYTGVLPILVLRAFGPGAGLLVLRGASVAAHAALLVVIALLLGQRSSRRALAGWALPLIATCPAWLLSVRIGIEVTMFNALFVLAGLYLIGRGGRSWALAGGCLWGLAIYNHVLGLYGVLAAAGAWLLVYHRGWRTVETVAWGPLLAGLALGLSPRALALVLYDNTALVGAASGLSLRAALADLRWTPSVIWDTLHGRTLYLRYVGHVAHEIAPYWLAGLGVLLPWRRAWRSIPRAAVFALVAVLLCSVITTLGAPYLESRYLVLPVIGIPIAIALLGAGAIERDARARHLVRALAALLVAGNLYYALADYYLPWHRRELAISSFRIGARSPAIGSWHFLPKDGLARELRRLEPAPEQIVTPPSLQMPLEALINASGHVLRIVPPAEADPRLRSIYVDYRSGRPRYCMKLGRRRTCFVEPTVVDDFFMIYRPAG